MLVRKKLRVSSFKYKFKGSILLLLMFVWPEMGYVQAKIGLTGQFDRSQPGNYLQPCTLIPSRPFQFAVLQYCCVEKEGRPIANKIIITGAEWMTSAEKETCDSKVSSICSCKNNKIDKHFE